MFGMYHKTLYICTRYAEIAQLVEHNLAKVRVASSSLVFRSFLKGCSNGGIGRHEGLKIPWPVMAVRVQVPLRVQRMPCNHLIMRLFLFSWVAKGYPKATLPILLRLF